MRENIIKGTNVGFLLLISSILTLRFTNDFENTMKLFNYFVPILIGYVVIGIIFQWIRNLPSKGSSGSLGIGIYYWVSMIMIVIPVLGMFIEGYIRYIILVNVIVIIVLWAVDYMHLSKVAKELNGGRAVKHKTLIVDLKSKPKTKEEFFRVLEENCMSNEDSLEYIERDIPAIIRINGILYKAEIGYYYSVAGEAVYTLRITEF